MAHPVHWWPARLAQAGDGVYVLGVEGSADRTEARRRIRSALREALAQITGLPGRDIAIESTPGQAPVAPLAGGAGIAISHEGGLSLAAINLHGRVGVDLMRVQDVPELAAVARDYLGPGPAAALAALAPGERTAAFARAWTEHEARLKCLGRQLAEWSEESQRELAACRCVRLDLPAGLAGSLAIL